MAQLDHDPTPPFSAEDFAALTAIPRRVRGDMPSEILPGLFLGGHPARYTSRGRAVPHAARHLAEHAGVVLTINCCAPPSAHRHVAEDLRSGEKRLLAGVPALLDCVHDACARGDAEGQPQGMLHLNLALEDAEDVDLSAAIREAREALRRALVPQWQRLLLHGADDTATASPRGALVHCQAGVSRSASVLAAFLVWAFRGAGLERVLAHLVRVRPCVDPNPGFMRQLGAWEAGLGKASGAGADADGETPPSSS